MLRKLTERYLISLGFHLKPGNTFMAVKKEPVKKKAEIKKPSPAPAGAPNNLLKKFLREAVVLITGRQSEEIVDLLDTTKHVNEFIIAKKLDLTINQTRNILYKISDRGLVSSIRKKDKRKGWYTYFWRIEVLKSLEFLKENFSKKVTQLEHQVKSRETKRFYVCERCHLELNEENALLHEFTCNECGDILTLKDNTKLLREMKKSLDWLRRNLISINEEISKESEKIEKKKARERKKTAKKKVVKRKAALKKTRLGKAKLKKKPAAKKKVVKKETKKVAKKKPVKKKPVAKKKVVKKTRPSEVKLKKKPAKKVAKKSKKGSKR